MFAVIVVDAAVPHTSTIVVATALTVTASLVLHGLTARPLTERHTRALGKRPRPASIEADETVVCILRAGQRWPRAAGDAVTRSRVRGPLA